MRAAAARRRRRRPLPAAVRLPRRAPRVRVLPPPVAIAARAAAPTKAADAPARESGVRHRERLRRGSQKRPAARRARAVRACCRASEGSEGRQRVSPGRKASTRGWSVVLVLQPTPREARAASCDRGSELRTASGELMCSSAFSKSGGLRAAAARRASSGTAAAGRDLRRGAFSPKKNCALQRAARAALLPKACEDALSGLRSLRAAGTHPQHLSRCSGLRGDVISQTRPPPPDRSGAPTVTTFLLDRLVIIFYSIQYTTAPSARL